MKLIYIILLMLLNVNAFAVQHLISRTSCTHKYVPLPQVVDVYYRSENVIPCKVFYKKNNKVTTEGKYQNTEGGCERIEVNIIENLLNGGYTCTHSLITTTPQETYSSVIKAINKSVNQVEHNKAIILKQLSEESAAHSFVAKIKRQYPNVDLAIIKQGATYKVAAGTAVSKQDVSALVKDIQYKLKIKRSDIVVQTMGAADSWSFISDDWQRNVVVACFKEGNVIADQMTYCSDFILSKEEFKACYYGGSCSPRRLNNYIQEGKDDLISKISSGYSFDLDENYMSNKLGSCQTVKNKKDFDRCIMDKMLPDEKKRIYDCFGDDQSDNDSINCALSQKLSSEDRNLLECLEGANDSLDCAVQRYGGNDLQTAKKCIEKGDDEYKSCLLNSLLPENAQKAITCYEGGTDTANILSCVAGDYLPPEQKKLLDCAVSNNDSLLGFAACAGGDQLGLNPEQTIGLECATTTGGEPVSFTSCAIGRLTMRELTKCFTDGVGGKGCFGENNEIVKHYTNTINDIMKGPGKGNEIVKVRDLILGNRGGFVADFIRDPGKQTVKAAEDTVKAAGKVVKKVVKAVEGHAKNAANDIKHGPGKNNDLVGKNGWVSKRLGIKW